MKQKVLFAARMINAANTKKRERIKGSLNDIDNSAVFLGEKVREYFKRKRIYPEDQVLSKNMIINLGNSGFNSRR